MNPTKTTPRGTTPRVIQFPHPGFEHKVPKKQSSGLMDWNRNKAHDRKYMATPGSVLADLESPRDDGVLLGLWGEWEAPSQWERIPDRGGKYHPSVVHTPLLPDRPGVGWHQNTDPLVFGDAFRYTNCKMNRRPMRGMPAGSIVLFGRGMNIDGVPRFVLDTCFVVEEWEEPLEFQADEAIPYGQDLVTDLVVSPFRAGSTSGRVEIHPYRARMHTPGSTGTFSFFPTVRHADRPKGFARPILTPEGALHGILTETLKQGMRPNYVENQAQAEDIWHEVVHQVLAQGCELGVHAGTPQRWSQ